MQINWNKTSRVYIRKEFKPHRVGLRYQHGGRLMFWDPNMAGGFNVMWKHLTDLAQCLLRKKIILLITSFASVANTAERFHTFSTRFSAPVNTAVSFVTHVTMAACFPALGNTIMLPAVTVAVTCFHLEFRLGNHFQYFDTCLGETRLRPSFTEK